jgi:hypothetical protein
MLRTVFFINFHIISKLLFYKMYDKYTGKTMHVCVFTDFSFCVFNFMLPAYRRNFPEVVFATYKVEQA